VGATFPAHSYPVRMEYLETNQPTDFKRFCKTLRLQEDAQLIAEYQKVHAPDAVWPEIDQGMREVGILDMEIYLLDNLAFMVMDTVVDFDHDRAMQALAAKPRQAEWEAFVSAFQQTSATATADQKWRPMARIYKLRA
jgi:L-rhamnose mutarotase